jgi:hypothetical protein
MVFCKFIAYFCQIQIFVYGTDIDSGRAWLTVVAISAGTLYVAVRQAAVGGPYNGDP